MTNVLQDELALRAAVTFDEGDVLDAVRRKVAARRVRRQRSTVGAAGFVVVALAVGAVAFARRSPQAASPPVPAVVVSAAPAVGVDPGVLASSVTVVKQRLTDVAGVSVESTDTGGIIARGPLSARDRIVAAVSAVGQFNVRPVLTIYADLPSTTPSTLPAQPTGSAQDQQTWQKSAIAAANRNSLPCQRTQAPAIATRPLVSCNQSNGYAAVLAPAIMSGLVRAEMVKDPTVQSQWLIEVTLDETGQRTLAGYSAGHVGTEIAFTIDNQTISIPTIAAPITSATVTISAEFSNIPEANLKEYVQEMTHQLPVPFHVTDVSTMH